MAVPDLRAHFWNSTGSGRLRVPGLSLVAKRLTYQDWMFRKHRYQFPLESSCPWGRKGAPGQWLSFEQAKTIHKKARERHFKKSQLGQVVVLV